ncbi:TRAP transporter small permease [Shouchella shacheensis]|uniref:TRAP transporter small permease n=1 Tax=Shouchella shacheensis TaxID=1649580 RepID=UPI00074050CE|nr:TRAP transporter small permease [Shouchella shacheensis]
MKAVHVLDRILAYLTIIFFTSLLVVVIIQIMSRYFPYNAIWTEELSRYLFVYAIAFAAPLALRKNEFIRVDMLIMALPEKGRRIYESVIAGLVFVFAVFLLVEGVTFYRLGLDFVSPTVGIQMSYVYAMVPVLAVLLMLYSVIYIIDRITNNIQSEGDHT